MLFHYFHITLQNLKKQPGFSAIKILSLATGLVCSVLVLMHVQYIGSYDKHIPNWENTYRLVADLNAAPVIMTDISADPYAEQMLLDYPAIELIARVRPASGTFARADNPLPNGFHWVDPDISKIFSLRFTAGNAEAALSEPNSLIISETAASKFFGNESPLGKTLRLDNRADLNVTGVFQDLPDNTHINFEILIPVSTARQLLGEDFMAGSDWMNFSGTRTYLTFPDRRSAQEAEADLGKFVAQNFPPAQRELAENRQLALSLEPLADIYLSPRRGFNQGIDTNASAVKFLGLIAVVVLLTSCINFASLSLSQALQRGKELGVKKALGAQRGQLVIQLLVEALLQTLLALLVALPVVLVLSPYYTAIIGSAIGVNFTPAILLEAGNLTVVLLFVLATGVLSGLVPAFVLSRPRPSRILRGGGTSSRRSRYVRPLVTVLQFTFAASAVMVTVAAYRQMDYMTNMDLGFAKDNLVVIDNAYDPANPGRFNYAAMRNELAGHPGITALASADAAPPGKGADSPWRLESSAPDDVRIVRNYTVDTDYIATMGLELLAGRVFDAAFSTDFSSEAATTSLPGSTAQGAQAIVITRDALRNFGIPSPEAALDQLFFLEGKAYRVIGVVDDYYVNGAVAGSTPLANILRASSGPLRYFLLQTDPAQLPSVVEHIDTVWKRHRPDAPVNRLFYQTRYRFIVDSWRDPIMNTTLFASVITILISICGLYALAFYSTRRRTKEVGVRKVMGASRASLVALLTWDFVKPVLYACAVACVSGYYAIRWIYQLFLFNPDVPYWLYGSVAAITLLVAAATVAYLCFKAAATQPVKSLRYE